MNVRFQAAVALIAVALISCVGCGGGVIDTDSVEGTVTYKGAPVEGASVMFSPVSEGQGNPAYAVTDAKGHYILQTQQGAADAGTTPGDYKVTVSKVEMIGTGKTTTTPEGEKEEITESKEALPKKYKFQKDTPLTATVEAGKANVFDFQLED